MNLVIIQARYDSTRFPGKILKKINGKSLLEILILRIKRSKLVDKIIIATTKEKNDDKIINHIKKLNVEIYRGSSTNVLQRYFFATKIIKSKIYPYQKLSDWKPVRSGITEIVNLIKS